MKKILALVLTLTLCLSCLCVTAVADIEGDYAYEIMDRKAIIIDYNGEAKDLVIPATLGGMPVTAINEVAFYRCKNLTTVTIPDGVTTLGEYAFVWCGALASVKIPNSVTTIGVGAFAQCNSLTDINVSSGNSFYKTVDGMLFTKDGKTLVRYPGGKSNDSYTIPDDVTTIGDEAFAVCGNLTTVTIPDGVTTIGELAFLKCDNLTTVTIPDSVTIIEEDAFEFCYNLTIYGYTNSTAEAYAVENGIDFVSIGELNFSAGDLNGDTKIDAKDALMVLKFAVNKMYFIDEQKAVADVNKDTKIDAKDALEILKFAVGKPSVLQG